MRRLLDRRGMAGWVIGTVIWGCMVLVLGSPFIGRSFSGLLYSALLAPPLAALDCPLTLSGGETKTITATIADAKGYGWYYLVTMSQLCGSSCAPVELCEQRITIEPGGKKTVSCPVRLDDLRGGSSEQTWHIVIEAAPEHTRESNPENTPFGLCFIRSKSSFWIELAYGGGVILTALAIILWGAVLWPRGTRMKRALIFSLSMAVYGLAWLMNAMVWLGLGNLHLFFLVLAGMLLAMYLVLSLAG